MQGNKNIWVKNNSEWNKIDINLKLELISMVISLSDDYLLEWHENLHKNWSFCCIRNWVGLKKQMELVFESIGMDWNFIKWFCIWMKVNHKGNASVSNLKIKTQL